jgi:hypothetical protein
MREDSMCSRCVTRTNKQVEEKEKKKKEEKRREEEKNELTTHLDITIDGLKGWK